MSKKYILLFTIIWFIFQPFETINAALRTKVRICAVKGSVQTGAVSGDGITCPLKQTLDKTECRVVNQATMIETGSDGWANIEYANGRKVKIMPNTKVVLERDIIYVHSGSSWFKVEVRGGDQLHVKTPTAIAGIRGTEFVVNVKKDGSSNFQLIEGSIEISDVKKKSNMMLAAGMEISIAKGSSTLNTALLKINENNKWWTDWPTLIPIANMPGYPGNTSTPNNDGSTFYPIADNHVYAYSYSNWNNTNWGKYDQIGAGWNPTGGEKRAFLKFDLSNVDPNSLEKATLRLYHNHTGGRNTVELGVYAVEGPWVEGRGNYKPASAALPGELTWNNQPKIARYPVVYFNPGQGTNKWVEADVTSLVKAWLTGFPNYGMAIKTLENYIGGTESQYGFYSREYKDTDKRPHIILNGSTSLQNPQGGLGGDIIKAEDDTRPWVIGTTNSIHYGTNSGWMVPPGGGRGKDISIDGNSHPWVIGTDNGIYYHDDKKWVQYPGGGKGSALAVASDGTPWVIGAQNRIYYGTGSTWAEQPGNGKGKDIAVDRNGRPWVIGTDNGIYYYEGRWIEYRGGGRGSKLAISPNGTPWVVGNDKDIFYHDGSRWVRQPGGKIIAKDIAIDDQNRPWVLKSDNRIFYHNGNEWVEYPGGGLGLAIAVSTYNKSNINLPINNLNSGSSNSVNGQWEWFTNVIVTIYPDNTVNAQSGDKGVLSQNYVGNHVEYVISWNNGQYVDRLTLNGNTLEGKNQNGTPVWGKRINSGLDNVNTGNSNIPKIDGDWEITCNDGNIYKYNLKLIQYDNGFYGDMIRINGNEANSKVEGMISQDGNIEFTRSRGNWKQYYVGRIVNQSGGKAIQLEGTNGTQENRGFTWNANLINAVATNISLAGQWQINQHNGYDGTLTLQQNQSGRITGTANWNQYDNGTIEGQLLGNNIEFTIRYASGDYGKYTGKVTQSGIKMSGTAKAKNGASPSWDAYK